MSTATHHAAKTLRIGMIGLGTVGGGVYNLVMGVKGLQSKACITKICVRDVTKPRDFEINSDVTSLVTDVTSILEDDEIDCVVEVMGGVGLAKTVVFEALKKGKSVVTANKALIAENMDELVSMMADKRSMFGYEAAVCGGIPIINTLQSCYTGDNIHEVMGICNGTTTNPRPTNSRP